MNTDDRALADLKDLQEWMREPDYAETFGTKQIIEWMNRRPTHVVPKVLATLDRLEAFHAKPLDRPTILVGARAWWKAKMLSNFVSAEIKGDGRVVVYWRDSDESGKYTLPVDFLAAMLDVAPIPQSQEPTV